MKVRYGTIRQTVKIVGLNEYSIRCMVKRGSVPGFRVGNRFYVDLVQFQEQLDADSRAAVQTTAEAKL